jgi:hypothetical protein
MMMRPRLIAAAAGLLLAACAAMPPAATPTEPGAVAIAPGPLDLGGEWRRASVGDVASRFERSVTARYGAGLTITQASGDLRANAFRCSAPQESDRGAPPDQVCSHTETAGDCTHTWQVHLFKGDNDALARTRALYDRRCGGDGLLGGPG